jgi:polyisoprenoid-binding protein YceI
VPRARRSRWFKEPIMAGFQFLARLAAVGLLGGLTLFDLPTAAGQTFRVDPVHSSMLFRVKHMNTSYIWGRFNECSGTVKLDDADPSFAVQVKVDSIDTANAKRDQHLEGPDFFSARQFPTISFKSTNVKKLGPTTYDVEGTLTLHGVSKPIQVRVDRIGTTKGPMGGTITGLSTTFTIKRSDFGMKFMLQGVGDEVLVSANLECDAK